MHTGITSDEKRCYIQFSLIFPVLVFLSFLEFILNGKVFLVSDTISEYVTTLAYWGSYLRNVVKTLVFEKAIRFPQWDFSVGMGTDIISTLNWYVAGDPLTLLSVFVKPEKAIYLHHGLVVLRLYLSGIAFLFYCRYTERNSEYYVCGTLMYVFSGYAMFLAYRHTYFINSFIYLPFLYVGIERILHGHNPVFFSIAVFVSCVTNFYFFYILSILTIVYAVVRFFFVHRDMRLRNFARCFLMAFLGYMIGVLLASVVFLPNIFGFLDCGRSGSLPTIPLFYGLKYYLKIIIASITPSYISSYTYLGFASVFLPLLVLCFVRKGNRDVKIFGIIYLVFLSLPIVGSAFNGFGYITNRWGFANSFFAGILAVRMFPELAHLSKKEYKYVLGIPLLMCMAVFAGCFVPGEISGDIKKSCLLSYLLLFATIALIFFLNAHHEKISAKSVRHVFFTLVCLSVSVNAYERFSPRYINYVSDFFDRGWANPTAFGSADALANETHDDTFWRYEYPTKNLLNNSMLFGTNGTSFYFSEINGNITDFFELYGLYTGDEQHLRGFDRRTALQAISSVKYYIQESEIRNVPKGFLKVEEGIYNGTEYSLYKNENFLPIGFLYRRFISEEDFLRLSMVEKEAWLLNAAVVHDICVDAEWGGGKFENPSSLGIVVQNDFSVAPDESAVMTEKMFRAERKDASMYISFIPHENAANYLMLEDVYFEDDSKPRISVYAGDSFVGGFEIKENFSRYGHQFVINLGVLDADIECTVQVLFHEKGVYNIEAMRIVSLPYAWTESIIEDLGEHIIEDVYVEDDVIFGKIHAESASFLFLSIPFSRGWKAFIDGKKVPLHRTQVMYCGCFISEGEHSVMLKYSNPFIKAGGILSLVGCILLGCVIVLCKRNLA